LILTFFVSCYAFIVVAQFSFYYPILWHGTWISHGETGSDSAMVIAVVWMLKPWMTGIMTTLTLEGGTLLADHSAHLLPPWELAVKDTHSWHCGAWRTGSLECGTAIV
jgi:hypothetical protein